MKTRLILAPLGAMLLTVACGSLAAPTPHLLGDLPFWGEIQYRISASLPHSDLGTPLGETTTGRTHPQRFQVYLVRGHDQAPQTELGFVPLGHGLPHTAYLGFAQPDAGTWTIRGYTVRELTLPASFFRADNREFVLGTDLLTIGTSAPYTVTSNSLVSKRTEHTAIGPCETQPYWEDNGSLPWLVAPLVCVQRKAASRLFLVGDGGSSVRSYALPTAPSSGTEYALWALGFDAGSHPYIMWYVQQSEGPAPLVGSGLLNLGSGGESPIPAALRTALFVSPNGTLYAQSGSDLAKWTGTVMEPLGKLSDPRVEAVSDDGAVWASWISDPGTSSYAPRIELEREVPGAPSIRSWTVQGAVAGYGPGYIVWQPDTSSGPIKLMFPLARRTLTFRDVMGQALIYGPTNGETVTQILVPTSFGASVIEISTKPSAP